MLASTGCTISLFTGFFFSISSFHLILNTELSISILIFLDMKKPKMSVIAPMKIERNHPKYAKNSSTFSTFRYISCLKLEILKLTSQFGYCSSIGAVAS